MRITAITAYRVELPMSEGSYRWSRGQHVEVLDTTLVRIDTDVGLSGWGEICPAGSAYLPAYPAGARTGIAELAPALIGADPRELSAINKRMDAALKGHPYVKSPLDIACWDLLGKATGLPVATLFGGHLGKSVTLYRAISQDTPEMMAQKVVGYRKEGYRRFQLKVGGEVGEDIDRIRAVRAQLHRDDILIADANTGWLPGQALQVARAVDDLDVYFEQPCETYEECLSVRRAISHPLVLDESIYDVGSTLRAIADRAMDAINLKISKVGGLTRARVIRDLCVEAGIALTIEDTLGSDIMTAAIAHLAHSTPERSRFTATDFNSYVTKRTAEGAPLRVGGDFTASTTPGLGIAPIAAILGAPVLAIT